MSEGRMPIKRIHCIKKQRASGDVIYYYRTHRGKGAITFWTETGTPLDLKDKLPEGFAEAYSEARKRLHSKPHGTFSWSVDQYLASPDYLHLAKSTQREYSAALKLAKDMPLKDGRAAGDAPLSAFDDKRMAGYIKQWHAGFRSTPRMADMRLNALRQHLDYCKSEGWLETNKAKAVRIFGQRAQKKDRGSNKKGSRAWTDQEIAQFRSKADERKALACQFLAMTGMRRKDACEAEITEIREHVIVLPASKASYRKDMIIPILPSLRPVLARLDEIRKELRVAPTTILFNSRGKPWTPDGLSSSFDAVRKEMGIEPTIHGLRKTAATRWKIAAKLHPELITKEMIEGNFGWENLDDMEEIYVDAGKVIDAVFGTEQKQKL